MSEPFVVPARYCGPPESGNGGWVSGHLARLVATTAAAPAVSVRLRTPPPLDRPLQVRPAPDGGIEVLDGEVGVALGWAAPAPGRDGIPGPIAFGVALEAGASFEGLVRHPFPTCFACGTAREPAEALGLRPGEVPGSGGVHAAAWVPREGVSTEDVWAALDCPGAWALGVGGRAMVLGTMTALVAGLPEAGREHVVLAWARGSEGRKHFCGTALYAGDGRLVAQADATWITIDPAAVRPMGGPS